MAKTILTIGKGEGCTTATKAKAILKADLTAVILNALKEAYGEDAAAMLRIVSPTTGKGEDILGVICGDFTEDSTPYDAVCTIKLTAKEWVDRVGAKQTRAAFDFSAAKKAYDEHTALKAASESTESKSQATKTPLLVDTPDTPAGPLIEDISPDELPF